MTLCNGVWASWVVIIARRVVTLDINWADGVYASKDFPETCGSSLCDGILWQSNMLQMIKIGNGVETAITKAQALQVSSIHGPKLTVDFATFTKELQYLMPP